MSTTAFGGSLASCANLLRRSKRRRRGSGSASTSEAERGACDDLAEGLLASYAADGTASRARWDSPDFQVSYTDHRLRLTHPACAASHAGTMGYPRSHLVDPDTPGVYHCVSRCVRRAFLCGVDKLTRRSYEHRRQLLEDRIHLLAQQFAVSIHAYAVMSNHVHLVIATDPALPKAWSDEEVHARWRKVMPKRAVIKPVNDNAEAVTTEDQPLPQASPADIARWRERLGSLSWFMRRLLEPRIRMPEGGGWNPCFRPPQTHEEWPGKPTAKTSAPVTSGRAASSARHCSTTARSWRAASMWI